MAEIELSKMIIELRKTLEEAQKEGEGKAIQFLVRDTELEASVKVTDEGSAGIKFWVLQGGGSSAKEQTQKITLKLQPITMVDGTPRRIAIADEDTK
ncbi:MAG: trypco2 family protein [Planctomycetota bacterium]